MKRQELQAEFDRLSNQIAALRQGIGAVPDEIISLACQQVCVSICGSLEQSLKAIFIEYAKRRSNSCIFRPIEKVCEGYQNPKTSKVLELVGLFDNDFEKELKLFWEGGGDAQRSHLNSLVDDRISIAHRKTIHVNISTGRLQDYHKAYSSLLTKIYDHFLQ